MLMFIKKIFIFNFFDIGEKPPPKPEEVPNVMPYEPEISPLIFYYPHVTEPGKKSYWTNDTMIGILPK